MFEMILVTPFGECGLKSIAACVALGYYGHSLRGVWVEIIGEDWKAKYEESHSLRGVWVEIRETLKFRLCRWCHSLRGVWVEMSEYCFGGSDSRVTPFGECGLKSISSQRLP